MCRAVWLSPIVLTALVLGRVDAADWTTGGTTPFRLTDRGAAVVQVRIGEAATFPFLLDTGTGMSAISERVARQVHAPADGVVEVVGVVGRTIRPAVRIAAFRVESAAARSASVMILPDERFRSEPYVGIVGQDVLSRLHYTVDYRQRRIEWHAGDSGCAPIGIELPLLPADGRYLVELPQERGVLRLVPDTGAQQLVFYDRGTNSLPRLYPTPGLVRLDTPVGQRRVQAMVVGELRVGAERLLQQPATVVDRHDAQDVQGDGVLPMHLFSRVTFDAARLKLRIEN